MDSKNDMLDLTGKLIIKVQLGDDIRRIPIHNEAITYDELVLMMQRVFKGKFLASDDVTIKYKDDDGDLITIFDSSDLSFAIQCSRILKLQILPNTEKIETASVLSVSEIVKLKQNLRGIRKQIDELLDSLDIAEDAQPSQQQISDEKVEAPNPINKVNSSEFDPLKDKVQANGEEAKEVPKAVPTPPSGNDVQTSQPHALPAASMAGASQPGTTQSLTDYYRQQGQNYQMAYRNIPYPQQQYSYPGYGQQVDPAQVSSANTYNNPQQGTYPAQQYSHPPPVYTPGQGNPYSKGYTQPSPQHGYNMPPHQ